MPSSQDLQRSTRIVVLRVLEMRGISLGDPGPDDADMYARARIGGQPLGSAVIHDHDRYGFSDPNEPFTWFKAVPAVPDEGEPVESIEVEVNTGDVRFAGTDDDVYLRLSRTHRFALDKRLYNDFERGDRDTYSVPIDEAVRAGMRVGDITRVQIEKSRDGIAGGWRLGGVRLRVNGRVDLQQPARRSLARERARARGPRPTSGRRRRAGRRSRSGCGSTRTTRSTATTTTATSTRTTAAARVSVGYAPGPPLERRTTGGRLLGGRLGDGDEAYVRYRLETITPEPIRVVPPPPPPPPTGKPDLVITDFFYSTVTVKNLGPGPAGPFRVRAGDPVTAVFESFPGLAAGASVTRPLPLSCLGTYIATADDLEQVAETNELNNERDSAPTVC